MTDHTFSITAHCSAGFVGFWIDVAGRFGGLVGADDRDYNMPRVERTAGDNSLTLRFNAGQRLTRVCISKATAQLTLHATRSISEAATVYRPSSDINIDGMVEDVICVWAQAGNYITSLNLTPNGGEVVDQKTLSDITTDQNDSATTTDSSTTAVVVIACVSGIAALVLFTVWMRRRNRSSAA